MCICRLHVCALHWLLTSASFFQLYYLNSHVMRCACVCVCVRAARCPLGISGCTRDWPQSNVYEREDERSRGGREGSPLPVRYSIIWPCGFYRVVTWRTSPQTVFISFTSPFPEPLFHSPLRFNFVWLSPPFVFSSSSDKSLSLCLLHQLWRCDWWILWRENAYFCVSLPSENGGNKDSDLPKNKTAVTCEAAGKKVSFK